MSNDYQFDVLIIGSGAAGLMSAIQLSDNLSIAVIAKDKILEGSSYYAQGGSLLSWIQKIILSHI